MLDNDVDRIEGQRRAGDGFRAVGRQRQRLPGPRVEAGDADVARPAAAGGLGNAVEVDVPDVADREMPDFLPGRTRLRCQRQRRAPRQIGCPAYRLLPRPHRDENAAVAHLEFAADDRFAVEQRNLQRHRAFDGRHPAYGRLHAPVEVELHRSLDARERRKSTALPADGRTTVILVTQPRQLQRPG